MTEKPGELPPRLGKKLRRHIRAAWGLQTNPHLILHDLAFLNKELENGNYFFTDIQKEGTLLYTSGAAELSSPQMLTPKERQEKAQTYWEVWFTQGEEMLSLSAIAKEQHYLKSALFLLHQATERYLTTTLLVYNDYKPKTHDLEKLYRDACYADTRFKEAFPLGTEEHKHLFKVLGKAYIDSRYKLAYMITESDLGWLGEQVRVLRVVTVALCGEKMRVLGEG